MFFGAEGKKIIKVDIIKIRPAHNKSRKYFDEEELCELSQSIKKNGILQPLLIRKTEKTQKDEYEIISGERRLRAAVMAGLKQVPCIVMKCNQNNAAVYYIIDNLQKSELSPFEEAECINHLITVFHMKQSEIAERLGKNQSTVSNKLRLLNFDEEERQLILDGNLTERHARALLKISNREHRRIALSRIINYRLNVTQSEELIDAVINKGFGLPMSKEKTVIIKDIRIFVNTINKAILTMKQSGINTLTYRKENDEYIEYIIKIPKKIEKSKIA